MPVAENKINCKSGHQKLGYIKSFKNNQWNNKENNNIKKKSVTAEANKHSNLKINNVCICLQYSTVLFFHYPER